MTLVKGQPPGCRSVVRHCNLPAGGYPLTGKFSRASRVPSSGRDSALNPPGLRSPGAAIYFPRALGPPRFIGSATGQERFDSRLKEPTRPLSSRQSDFPQDTLHCQMVHRPQRTAEPFRNNFTSQQPRLPWRSSLRFLVPSPQSEDDLHPARRADSRVHPQNRPDCVNCSAKHRAETIPKTRGSAPQKMICRLRASFVTAILRQWNQSFPR